MKISDEAKRYALALSLMDGIGPIRAKKLIDFCGDPEAIFKASKADLEAIPGIGRSLVIQLRKDLPLQRADAEIARAERESWQMHYYQDSAYPRRMRHCEDGPLILFQKGHTQLNHPRVLAIVGTRNMSSYGKDFLASFTQDLADYGVLVISGLAYGVDAWAHKQSLENGIVNAAVLAHGLDRVYPYLHHSLASDIVKDGGSLLTEFPSKTNPDKENFPKRNRIIAGISDAVLVVEAARKGGALITAELANQYNRDVFAVPGRMNDPLSAGCNILIKSHRAHLFEGIKDLAYVMRWEAKTTEKSTPQLQLFDDLSPDEQMIFSLLGQDREPKHLDWLQFKTQKSSAELLRILMTLELKGSVESMPGSRFRLRS